MCELSDYRTTPTETSTAQTTSASTEVFVEKFTTTQEWSDYTGTTPNSVVTAASGTHTVALAIGLTLVVILLIAIGGLCGVRSIRIR